MQLTWAQIWTLMTDNGENWRQEPLLERALEILALHNICVLGKIALKCVY